MDESISPLAPSIAAGLPAVGGVRMASAACGIKKSGALDVMIVELAPGTSIAGLLTRSQCPSAAVDWCRAVLPDGRARAIVVNSGNANAFTGRVGQEAVRQTVTATAGHLGCAQNEVLVASTGVIGEAMPAERLTAALPDLCGRLDPDRWRPAAEAILTTDTFPKMATRTARIGDAEVRLNGFAKGSGMIAPDMATMLAFLFTDARLPAEILRPLLADAADRSFHAITVDGDTSTSDTLLLCATGAVDHPPVTDPDDGILGDFRAQLTDLATDLAQQVVRDGEGAQKFVTITVTGAASDASARRVGLAVGNSPLVKTAIAGEDANWGRIVMAVGKSGEQADRDRLTIAVGGVEIARHGQPVEGYDETPVGRHMKGQNIEISVDLGIGQGASTVWTCDLTHGYIRINADYRS